MGSICLLFLAQLHQAQPSDSLVPSMRGLSGQADRLTFADLQHTMVDTYGKFGVGTFDLRERLTVCPDYTNPG